MESIVGVIVVFGMRLDVPKLMGTPFRVIALFDNFALVILPSNIPFVMLKSGIV